MILTVWSDRPTFKNMRFSKGLNLILTSRTGSSSSGDKRNAAGKSSVLEIIHFLFGSDLDQASPLAATELAEDTFFISFRLFGGEVTASRKISEKGKISISADFSGWPILPNVVKETGEVYFGLQDWKDLLGRAFFSLPRTDVIAPASYLSFRTCFSYFVRRSRTGGYDNWHKAHTLQKSVDAQVNLAFLFGLDYIGPLELNKVKEREQAKKDLQRAIRTGMLDLALPNAGKLKASYKKLLTQSEKLSDELSGFKVVEAYGDLEIEANDLQREIDLLSNANLIDRELVEDIESALKIENPPELPELAKLYGEAGVVLPDVSLAHYDLVQKFHQAVVENRRNHLESERADASSRILQRDNNRRGLSARRNQILEVLNSGGALSQYRALTTKLYDVNSELSLVTRQIEQSEKLESLKADLRVDRAQAERKIKNDIIERRPIVVEAAAIFDEIERRLYDDPASFDIVARKDGLEFLIYTPDIASTGVKRAQIFAFDITLATICAKRGAWPGFLIHDSHVFDGVDGRQVASALLLGNERLRELGGQYIVTMNSDDLEKAEKEGNVSLREFVVSPILDDSENGGLFGFRFASPKARSQLSQDD